MRSFKKAPEPQLGLVAGILTVCYLSLFGRATLGADLLSQARRQGQPRRWPWQPKTIRDSVDAYRTELTALVSLQGAALLDAVQRQSRPRRWPWQAKTIRDLLEERSVELTSLAADWSTEQAEAIAKRAAALRATVQHEIQPRRWPWQAKTLRDRVSEQNAELASRAAERSATLALLARQRRDALIDELRRQSQPRRWPWQPKTIRDQIGERGEQVMAKRVAPAAERLTHAAHTSAQAISQTASDMGERLNQLATATPSAIDAAAAAATGALKETGESVRAAVNTKAQAAAATATDALKETGQSVRSAVSTKAQSAAAAVQRPITAVGDAVNASAQSAAAAVQRPITAVGDTVEAGRRRVRRGVRLVRVALWALSIGVAIGLLSAKTSGAELRRQLGALVYLDR